MRLKWTREMVSMKSEETVSANGIDAKGNNDWIEGGAGVHVANDEQFAEAA